MSSPVSVHGTFATTATDTAAAGLLGVEEEDELLLLELESEELLETGWFSTAEPPLTGAGLKFGCGVVELPRTCSTTLCCPVLPTESEAVSVTV